MFIRVLFIIKEGSKLTFTGKDKMIYSYIWMIGYVTVTSGCFQSIFHNIRKSLKCF